MPDNENGKQTLSTFVESHIADAVRQEAEMMQVSVAAVIRWALMDRYPSPTPPDHEHAASVEV